MECCNNNIYPSLDLVRWESCDSVQLANADNYYTKKEVDDLLDDIVVSGDGITADEAQDLIDSSLEGYYDKDEIDAAFDTVNSELDGKLDASAYTPTDLTGYATEDWVENKGYLTEHQHLKTINNISLVGDGNIEIGSGGTTDLSNYYNKQETNNLLDDKLDASAYTPTDLSGYWTSGETQDAINAATSGIPSSATIEGLRNDINALSGDVSNLYETKLDASAYTPTDLSGYYSKSQVDDIFAELQAQIDALHNCCDGGDDTGSTDVKKYVLHSGGTEYSMDCNSSSTLSREDLVFNSGTSIRASAVTDVTIGDCVTNIGAMAMQYFSAMTSVTIPSSVTSITYSAFDGCISLPSLTIPSGVTIIPYKMCYNDYLLASTNIPEGVTRINDSAYSDCLSLMNITIPSTVTVIGNSAFRTSSWTSSDPTKYQMMQNIATGRTVTILAETPPTLGDGVFGIQTGSGDIATYPIYVPAASVNDYKTASGWSVYANRIFAIP